MGIFERLGSADPNAERAAENARKATLEDIKEEIGAGVYEDIIAKLYSGDINDLSPEEKAIIARIKESRDSITH